MDGDPTTSDRIYSDEEREFLSAIQEYKDRFKRPFPRWCEILRIVYALGYRKVAKRTAMNDPRPKKRLS